MATPSPTYPSYFFNNELFSDVTIQQLPSDGTKRQYYCHRMLLFQESAYFWTLFTGPWKESGQTEIELKDDDPTDFEIMLKLVYGADWKDVVAAHPSAHNSNPETQKFELPIAIYRLADKYDFERARTASMRQISERSVPGQLK